MRFRYLAMVAVVAGLMMGCSGKKADEEQQPQTPQLKARSLLLP